MEQDHIHFMPNHWEDAEVAGWTGPGWYFWDEAESHCHGPYRHYRAAELALQAYVRELNGTLAAS